MSDKEMIQVKEVSKVFGDHPERAFKYIEEGRTREEIMEETGLTVAVNNVSFGIDTGETFVIMGLSGSGKSTIIRCLNRLIEPNKGQVFIDGEDVTAMDDEQLREIRRFKTGMVFQNFALFPHRSVLQNVAFGLEIQGVEKEERESKAMDSLQLVGLKGWENSMPAQLSGGMQQRVGLARALASDPPILLMDEAFSALDPLIRSEMQDELLDLQDKMHKTVVFITHDLDEALKIGDRIVLLKDGAIDQIGTAEEILTRPATEYVAKFVEGVDMAKVLKAEGVMTSPREVAYLKDGPRVAMRKMQEASVSSLFVVDRSRVLQGVVTADDVTEAAKRGEKTLESILIKDVPTVEPDAALRDIFDIVADSKVPVAVVDSENKLKGIIIRGAVLAGLVRETESESKKEKSEEEKQMEGQEAENEGRE